MKLFALGQSFHREVMTLIRTKCLVWCTIHRGLASWTSSKLHMLLCFLIGVSSVVSAYSGISGWSWWTTPFGIPGFWGLAIDMTRPPQLWSSSTSTSCRVAAGMWPCCPWGMASPSCNALNAWKNVGARGWLWWCGGGAPCHTQSYIINYNHTISHIITSMIIYVYYICRVNMYIYIYIYTHIQIHLKIRKHEEPALPPPSVWTPIDCWYPNVFACFLISLSNKPCVISRYP